MKMVDVSVQKEQHNTSGAKKHYYPCFSDEEVGLREITAQVRRRCSVGQEFEPRAQFCSRTLHCQTNSQTQNKAECLFLATLREVRACERIGCGRAPYVY